MRAIARRAGLILALLGALAGEATAQEVRLQQLRSSVPEERMHAFYALLYPDGMDGRHLRARAAALASRARRDDALAQELIALAAREQKAMAGVPGSMSEDLSNYYGDVICVVAALADPRSLPVLLTALPNGRLATDGLVVLGDTAVPGVVARVGSEDEGVRSAAVLTLGKMAGSPARSRLSDRSIAAIRSALLRALGDPNTFVRTNAVESLGAYGDAQVRASLVELAKRDTAAVMRGGARVFPVRDAAAAWLRAHDKQ